MDNETENKILRCEYEKLLFERDRVKKEADNYLRLYIHEFGELLTELFRKKISCIEKKKMINYCQTAVNYGKLIDIVNFGHYSIKLHSNITKNQTRYNKELSP